MPEVRASQKIWDAAVVGDVDSGGSKATGTLVSTGTDNNILVTSKVTGSAGNDIEIKTVHGTVFGVVTVGHVITVTLNSGVTTANAFITGIQGNVGANALVTVALTPDSSGAGFITDALDLTLTGGVDNVASGAAQIGPMDSVAVFAQVSGPCTLKIQASASIVLSSGRNAINDSLPWYDYVRAQALEGDNGVNSGYATIVFAAAGTVAVDCSPFAPTYLRLTRVDNLGTDVTITAFTVAVG